MGWGGIGGQEAAKGNLAQCSTGLCISTKKWELRASNQTKLEINATEEIKAPLRKRQGTGQLFLSPLCDAWALLTPHTQWGHQGMAMPRVLGIRAESFFGVGNNPYFCSRA